MSAFFRKAGTLAALVLAAVFSCNAALHDGRDDATIKEILSRLDKERVSLDYNCTIEGRTLIMIQGSLLLQGNCYLAKAEGLEIYCDGKTRWTVDTGSKEVYVEDSEGIREILQYEDSLVEFSISNLKYSTISENLSAFVFDVSALGTDWLVTDLRGV